MKIMTVSNLSSGAVLAKTIFSGNGRPLLKQGVELTSSYITRLERMGFRHVYVEDGLTADIQDVDSIPMDIREEVVGRIEGMFKKLQEPTGLQSMVRSGELGREIVNIYNLLFSHLVDNNTMIVNLSALYANDALEFIFTRTYQQFDPVFVRYFVQHVNIYPVGLPVRLSNGTSGVIAKASESNLQRPCILITEEQNSPVRPYEFDLAKNLNVTIVGHKL